jgi:hypothetical protein
LVQHARGCGNFGAVRAKLATDRHLAAGVLRPLLSLLQV